MPYADTEKYREYQRVYQRGWKKRNREQINQHNRKRARNLKKMHFFKHRSKMFRDRFKIANTKTITTEALAEMWKKQKGLCALSGLKLNREAHLDHINPVSNGGIHEIENLRWVAPEVNRMKERLSDERLFELCKLVLERQSNGI